VEVINTLSKGKKEHISNYLPKGYYTCSKNVGIKDETLDFSVILSAVPASAAAMFTQNQFCGAPIPVGRENIANGQLRCFAINSKNANVATGEEGIENVREIIYLIGEELNIPPEDILPSSTGIIGKPLPMDKIRQGIKGLKDQLVEGGFEKAAEAIMTTDTHPKIRACKIGEATLVGIAKGSGMIEPNMATLLSYFVTDAQIPSSILQTIFNESVNKSFNMVSIDTDTSTSDTVAIMANGLAGEVNIEDFKKALNKMSIELAKEVARDGEGATKLIEVIVENALHFEHAKKAAKSIVNSPLVKSAIFGADPNWGRVVMAVGKCDKEIEVSPELIAISFGSIPVYDGKPLDNVDLTEVKNYLQGDEIMIKVSLNLGKESATVWGCDLSYDYVRINGEYTS